MTMPNPALPQRAIICSCKAVKASIGEPLLRTVCHCNDCRKANGGKPVQDLLFCRINEVTIQGELDKVPGSEYHDGVPRYFCKDCGTFIYGDASPKGWKCALFGPIEAISGPAITIKPQLHMGLGGGLRELGSLWIFGSM